MAGWEDKAPTGDEWELIESTPYKDKFVRKTVLREVQKAPSINISDGFHANTSAALPGIEKRKALVGSAQLKESDELKTGEVFGSNGTHREVFVYLGKIADGYGIPGWFDEYSVVFGVSIEKQKQTLTSQGKDFGLWSSSEGYEIGEEVPLENVTVILAPATKLDEAKKWATKNVPQAKVVSREAIYLIYGK